jgi:DMSO/TMAO reductase YedYZ molybdopterin-dependent catalytic subunit
MDDRTIGRAGFLGILGAGALGLFFARDVTGVLGRVVPNSVSSVVPTNGSWRIYTVASMPNIDPAAYKLSVDGLVSSPKTFTLADLKAMPRAEQVSDFHCVTGWSVQNVHWGGVRLHEVLDRAGALKSAKALTFVSAEVPYVDSLTLDQALLPDVMLAYDMNGKPLPPDHGAPLRLRNETQLGFKQVKWIKGLEFVDDFADVGGGHGGYHQDHEFFGYRQSI